MQPSYIYITVCTVQILYRLQNIYRSVSFIQQPQTDRIGLPNNG